MINNLAYICGPITSIPNDNLEEFTVAAATLKRLEWKTYIPQEIFEHLNTINYTHTDYMRKCIQVMMLCDVVYTLPNWYESKGATIEVNLARSLGIPVYSIISPRPPIHNIK